MILHFDLDAFYASLEARLRGLVGRAVVVGGLGPRGVVSAASYEARRLGVHSALPMSTARRRAPDAVFLTVRPNAYRAASAKVMSAARHVFDATVDPLSFDEAFVDLGHVDATTALTRARVFRRTVLELLDLPVSVGISHTRLVAKLSTTFAKPDGLLYISERESLDFLAPMPLTELPGVGPATSALLTGIGLHTVNDFRRADPRLLAVLGESAGRRLTDLVHARDPVPSSVPSSTSISLEETFDVDVPFALLGDHLSDLVDRLVLRVLASGVAARTLTLKARLPDFSDVSRSHTFASALDDPAAIQGGFARLLARLPDSPMRLLGAGVTTVSAAQLVLEPSLPPISAQSPPALVDLVYRGAHVHHRLYGVGTVHALVEDASPLLEVDFARRRLIEAPSLTFVD